MNGKDKEIHHHQDVYSIAVKAGKRTYFFDVKSTRSNDFYLTITESRREGDGYDKHKIFLYKEDFHKFTQGLEEVLDHIKTQLLPNFDFDQSEIPDRPVPRPEPERKNAE